MKGDARREIMGKITSNSGRVLVYLRLLPHHIPAWPSFLRNAYAVNLSDVGRRFKSFRCRTLGQSIALDLRTHRTFCVTQRSTFRWLRHLRKNFSISPECESDGESFQASENNVLTNVCGLPG